MGELDTAQEIVVQCRTGVRSAEIVHLCQQHGCNMLHDLNGGIIRWTHEADPQIPRY